ncbi:SDR family oxidoreductase [Azospirillum himalayense]|uniref:SDR family oxidoreductase n=1 Tax=Azospirillum himalayense TaxID=654847 RepID=A0ABW0G989_9PROT
MARPLFPGAFGAPESTADAALLLASDQAKNIYGQELVVDGGYTVGRLYGGMRSA